MSESHFSMKRREVLRGGAAWTLATLSATSRVKEAEAVTDNSSQTLLPLEYLGQPCRARNVHTGLVVQDAGREWFVITNTNESFHVELIFIDAETDSAQIYRALAGAGAWCLIPLEGNRLALGTYYDGMFLVFDVARREWIQSIKFSGETYIWTLSRGGDGRVYGGTYPTGKLGAFDPKTYAFEQFGAPSKENLYLRYTSALPDGRLFCQFGFAKPETMLFDPQTKQFSPAPAHLQSASQGIAWDGLFYVGSKAYRMPDLAETPLPFTPPDVNLGDWNVDLRLTSPDTMVLRQGLTVWELKRSEKTPQKVLTMNQRGGGALLARSEKGIYYGIRGQDYFTLSPQKTEAELRIIPGEAAPRDTHFLRVDDRGFLWGGPTFGQTLFYLNTKTKRYINTRTISNHGGEVYDVAVIDGVAYAVAYAGGEIIGFNPNEPWNQVEYKNPRPIANVGPDYIRPAAGVAVGHDGRLYAGWLAKYGTYGGLLSITDPATGATEKFKDPLGPHGLFGLAIVDESLVLLGSYTYGNGLGYQKDVPSKLGLWDAAKSQLVDVHEFPGAVGVGQIAFDPHSRMALFLVNSSVLHIYDVASRKLLTTAPIEKGINTSCLYWKEGQFLFGRGDTLYRFDVNTKRSTPMVKTPAAIQKIACGGPDNGIYLSCGVDVYRVKL